MERSKSTSHITQGIPITEVNSPSSQSMLGSRSLSHDSVFSDDQCQSDPERPMAVSQENIHGKIKALQMKLQKQKMHLGPQLLMFPVKQTEDPGGRPEHHLENLELVKNLPHKSQALQSPSQSDLTQPVTPTLPPLCASEVDFSMPPQFIRCLDNSAARHRMSVKPRNQRASTKNRRMPSSRGSRPRSESMTILEQPLTKNEEKEITRERSYSAKIIRPEESFTASSKKSLLLASPRKSLVGSEEDYPPSPVNQHVESLSPTDSSQDHILKQDSSTAKSTERAEVVVGTPQALKSVEGMAAKQIKSVLPTSPVGSGDQREHPYGSKLKSIQGSAVSNVNSEHVSSVGSDQSQGKAEKESKAMTSHEKRNELNDKLLQETMPKDHPKDPPQRHLALHRNAFPINDKVDSGKVGQISTAPLPSEEDNLQMEFPNQQRPVLMSPRTSVSSAKINERQRMENITQSVEQAGLNREPSFPSSLNIKTQEQLSQLRGTEKPTGKDTSQMRAAITPVPTTPTGLTPALSGGHEKGHNLANDRQKMRVECEEEEEIKEKSKDSSRNDEPNTFGVKLRSSSLSLKFRADKAQSGGKIKQPSAEVHSLTILGNKSQNDSSVGPVRDNMALTGLKTPPVHNTQPLSSTQVTRSRPQSAGIVQERMFHFSQPDLGPSSPPLSPSIKALKNEGTTACSTENNALQTDAKEPKETSPELSWIEMAREKTRSLQQLFTSRFTDLAGLQTVTRPAASPQTQTSSPGSVRPIHQISAEQSSARPLQAICSQPPTMQTSVRATHQILTQPPPMQSSTRPSQPTTDQSGSENLYLKRTAPTTIPGQATQLSARPNQVTSSSPTGSYLATKLAQSAGTCTSVSQFDTQTIHTTQLQHNLSSSPKNQPFQQSPSLMSQPRSQIGRGLAYTSSGQADCSSIPQGKWLIEGRVQRAPELRSKPLPIEQRQIQKHDDKAENQKSSPKFQVLPQDVAEYRSMYSHSRLTESTATSDPARMDKEAKSQKKTVLPSSPPLQPMTDSGQPSWMELAKRKSMAWSDKTMD